MSQRQLRQQCDAVLSEGVLRQRAGDQAIQKREHLRVGCRVLRPACHGLAVGVEVVDEVDEVVGQVATAVNVQDVRGVSLFEDK